MLAAVRMKFVAAAASAVAAAPAGAARGFHAAAAVQIRQKHLKRLNRLQKHWAKQLFRPQAEYVDPVLGKAQVPFLERVRSTINQSYNHVGAAEPERTSQLLYGAEQAALLRADGRFAGLTSETEQRKREALGRIIALNNASQQQFRRHATALAVAEFARAPGDTGSPEVQAAVATIHIQYLAAHHKAAKQDLLAKRKLEHLVQTRRGMLLYLKRTNPERYVWTVEKLGLTDEAVAAEFHMSRKYLWKTQFYGERTLPLKPTVKATNEKRRLDAKRSKALSFLANNPQVKI